MGYGYDFTEDDNESGFDFTTDDTELIAQEEAARASELWENLSDSEVQAEINGLNSRLTAFILQLQRMVNDNDYEKTAEMCKALYTKDLGPEGWLGKFYLSNQNSFAQYAGGSARPSWYANLSADQKKTYDAVLAYYGDAAALQDLTGDTWGLLRALPLLGGFRIMRIKDNFEEAGFTKAVFDKIDADLRAISDQLSQDWAAMDRNAERSMMYYDANKDRLPVEKLSYEYFHERYKDYSDNLKKSPIAASLNDRGKGVFTVRPDVEARMEVIDTYTTRVSQSDNLEDSMKNILNRTKKILSEDVPAAEKGCTTQAGQFLAGAFQTLAEAVSDFAEMSLEIYLNFRKGEDVAPYCFMKKLPSLGSAKELYSFTVDRSDPQENGTYFVDLYRSAAKAIGKHCEDFVFHHGYSDLL